MKYTGEGLTQTIARLRQLEAAATPGPWEIDYSQREEARGKDANIAICQAGEFIWPAEFCNSKSDAQLIAEMRNHIIPLLDRLEKLEAVAEAAELVMSLSENQSIPGVEELGDALAALQEDK